MEKYKCNVCGKEKALKPADSDPFHNPMCCGKKMFIAS